MSRCAGCLSFLLFVAMGAHALAQNEAYQSHQAWSTEEGLPQASVHAIFQSHDGYLWLATEGGAVRFDGINFETLSHEKDPAFTSDDVSAIAEDAEGGLWFGTSDGLVQRKGSSLRRYAERDGLPSASVFALATAGDGSLLVLTAAGLVRYDGTKFRSVGGMNVAATSMQSMPDGSVLLFAGREVLRYERGAVHEQALPAAPAEAVLGLQPGRDGGLWLRTARSVMLFAPGLRRVWTVPKDVAGSRMETLFVDRSGTAWIGTNQGLFTTAAQPGAPLRRVEALRADAILSVFEDREGNHWIGTESSGLHALRPRKFRSVAAAANDAITAVVQSSDGAVWFGTRDDGVRRIVQEKAETPVPASSLTSPVILSLAPGAHGDVWAGTPDGLNHIENGTVHRYTSTDGLPDDFVRSVLVDARGSVWAGTRYGLAHLQGGRFTTLTQADGLGSDSVGPLLEQTLAGDAGTPGSSELWIGTAAGLSRLHDGTLETFSTRQGLPGNIVTAVAQDVSGAIWVGVHGAGLSRFQNGHFDPIRSQALPLEIHGIAVDKGNHLWLRADRGVFRVSIAELQACLSSNARCTMAVDHYGVMDGMPSDELAAEGSPVVWQNAGGELLFATRKGLAIADPLHLPIDKVAPPVVIQRFIVDDAEQSLTGGPIRIQPGKRRYTFEYAGLSYTMPLKTRYRYKLEGLDRDWIDAGNRRVAYYTSLPARRYRFRVLAENNDGLWNEVGAEVQFVVLPPFYRRWWFYALAFFLLAGVAYLLFQLRLQRVRKQFALVLNERNRVAREIHDTLAQDFVSVSLQLEIAARLVKANRLTQATEQLQETRSLVKQGLEAARQSIWNLRANAAANSLPARLSVLVEQFARAHPAPQLKISGAYRQLRPEIEDEVVRIAQESLSNIDRHAAANSVLIELLYDRDTLLLTIRDDGCGFSYEAAREMSGHYGLRGMQERAVNLNGRFTVTSNPGEGTAVTLVVPLRASEGSQTW